MVGIMVNKSTKYNKWPGRSKWAEESSRNEDSIPMGIVGGRKEVNGPGKPKK